MSIENPLKNTRIEFHILQSFPVTCLNRDDVGAPKSAMIGGVQRARVSSQAWKRPVRMAMHDLGGVYGTRTKLISKLVEDACLQLGATEDQAALCGDKTESAFIKEKKNKKNGKEQIGEVEETTGDTADKADTLIFLSPSEVATLAQAFAEHDFDPNLVITKTKDKDKQEEVLKIISKKSSKAIDAMDIALFGRMVAQAAGFIDTSKA